MYKIIKTKPSSWQGVGFGTQGASYAVLNHPSIRVIRCSNGWYAYIGTRKYFGVTRTGLEFELSNMAEA